MRFLPVWHAGALRSGPGIGKVVVDAAIAIHKALGSGVYEIVYEVVLAHELKKHDLNVERQVPVSIEYDGIKFDEGWYHTNRKRFG